MASTAAIISPWCRRLESGDLSRRVGLPASLQVSTGEATLCAGCGQAGVTYHYVEVATGRTKPGGTIRAVRRSHETGAPAVAAC